jgi:hypothetical protein
MTSTKEKKNGTSAEVSPKRKSPETFNTNETGVKKAKGDKSLAESLGDLSTSEIKRIAEAFPVAVPPRDFLGRRGGISGPAGRPNDIESTKNFHNSAEKENIKDGHN